MRKNKQKENKIKSGVIIFYFRNIEIIKCIIYHQLNSGERKIDGN